MIDTDWLKDWLLRLREAVRDGDVFAQRDTMNELNGRPGYDGIAVVAEFLLKMVNDQQSAARVAMEIAERVAATKNVTINAGRDLIVQPGGVAGVDASSGKVLTGANP